MRSVYLEVVGEPKPKGSMSAFVLKCKHNGGPRAIVTHSSGSKKWEKIIRARIDEAKEPLVGPIRAELWFFLPRPKTAKRAYPNVRPDLDKLERAVLDAVKGAIEDDSRIVDLESRKRYAEDYGVPPSVCIHLQEMEDGRAQERKIFELVRGGRVKSVGSPDG